MLVEDGDAWLTQRQIGALYGVSRVTATEHICRIYEDDELRTQATCRNLRRVELEGGREVARDVAHYNTDMVLAVGYRVRSERGVEFRQWVTRVVKGEVEAPQPKAGLVRAPSNAEAYA